MARRLKGRRVAPGVDLFVWTAYPTYAAAQRLGYVDAIEGAGGHVHYDTCHLAATLIADKHFLVTPSFKQAHYARNMVGCQARVADVDACVEAAVSGRWDG